MALALPLACTRGDLGQGCPRFDPNVAGSWTRVVRRGFWWPLRSTLLPPCVGSGRSRSSGWLMSVPMDPYLRREGVFLRPPLCFLTVSGAENLTARRECRSYDVSMDNSQMSSLRLEQRRALPRTPSYVLSIPLRSPLCPCNFPAYQSGGWGEVDGPGAGAAVVCYTEFLSSVSNILLCHLVAAGCVCVSESSEPLHGAR